MQEAEFVEQMADVRMVRSEFPFSYLQRALGQRQRVIILPCMHQIRRLSIEFVGFMEQTIVLGRRVNFHQPNLITSRSTFEFCCDVQTICAAYFRHELGALCFLWPKLIIELHNQLSITREQALDHVDTALLNAHTRELAG